MAVIQTYQNLKRTERKRRIFNSINSPGLLPEQQKTLNQFYNHLISAGRTIETAQGYIHKAQLFGKYLKKPYEQADKDDIEGFLVNYSDYSVNYLNGLRATLSVFYQWLLNIDKTNPLISNLKRSRRVNKKTENDVLSEKDILDMANAAENFRNRFLITGGYESACRKSEFIGLKVGDIELKDKYAILHVDGKTGQRAVLIMNSFPDLINYLNHHPLKDDLNAPLFLNHNGLAMINKQYTSLGNYGFNDILRKLAKTAGIKKKVYPHVLRHSKLTHLAHEGYTEVELRKIAGWSNNSTMADVYVHQNTQQVMNKRLAAAGIIKETKEQTQQELMKPHDCKFCGEQNSAGMKYCGNCGRPLYIREIMETVAKEEKIMSLAMKNDNMPLKDSIKQILKEMLQSGEINSE